MTAVDTETDSVNQSPPNTTLAVPRVGPAAPDMAALQHPLDRQAIAQLRRVRGFEFFVSKFVEAGVERMDYALSTASSLRVGPRQLPRLYGHLREACTFFGVPEPELYVSAGGPSAVAAGPNHPYVVLGSGVVDMQDDEARAIVAHEVGHIKAGHLLYKSMAGAIDFFGDVANDLSIGFSRFVTAPIQAGLLTWERWSELTADRAALLMVPDPMVSMRVLMKQAAGTGGGSDGLDVAAFVDQVRAYTVDIEQTMGDRVYRVGATLYRGRLPFTVQRAKALLEWYDSGALAQVLAAGGAPGRTCPKCGHPVQRGHGFCGECGFRLVDPSPASAGAG